MNSLPIEEVVAEIKEKLSSGNTVILEAPPGAGKSTWLPLQLLNENWLDGKKILMLEPRRLAARTVAARLASHLGEESGETIGYRIRFEKKISEKTRIEILTEGILTRMLLDDASLENVGLVIFDEFHERSIHADLGLAICLEVQKILRPDLRILIMSATISGEKIAALLDHAPVITSQGRRHPVVFKYNSYEENIPLPVQTAKLVRQSFRENDGDVLVFLPGAGEILRTIENLEKENTGALIVPLYGDLSIQKQQEAIEPDKNDRRKIVLATSIAETSLTIEGIKIVVDSGFARVPRFDPSSGMTKLQTVRVTRDSADQRAGRAGRLGPGICYRLWSEGFDHHLIPHRAPEIEESDLASLLLDVMRWGNENIFSLTWITVPPRGAVAQAKELLEEIGATENGKITEKGKQLAKIPAHPRIANMLLHAKEIHAEKFSCDLVSILEERDPLPAGSGADIHLRIESLEKWRKREMVNADKRRLEQINRGSENWKRIIGLKNSISEKNNSSAGELLACAYPERIAKKMEGKKYRLANGRIAVLPEHDALLNEEYISIAQLDAGMKGEAKIFLAAALDPEVIAHLAQEKRVVEWDEKKGELVAHTELRFGEIILEKKILKTIPEEEKIKLVIDAVKKSEMQLLNISEEFLEFTSRVICLRKWNASKNWPDLSMENLVLTSDEWLAPYLQHVKTKNDLLKINLLEIISARFSYEEKQLLEKLAPQKLSVPSGSHIKIKYHDDGSAPVLAVRLQEIFGMIKTPSINNGKIKLLIHLLSPAYRPVQVTQDLESFWKNTYSEVRKDLRSRYPKHSWPEDPLTAVAVRGVKRK